MAEREKGRGYKRFKKNALVVLATQQSASTRSHTPPIRRPVTRDASARDVLNTFVDESLTSTPLAALARDKCGIQDALLLEG